jgi:hypothetical protein
MVTPPPSTAFPRLRDGGVPPETQIVFPKSGKNGDPGKEIGAAKVFGGGIGQIP